MQTCQDFEIAIEMRLHGALERASEEPLRAHLAGCASCRAFETLATNTEATMTTAAAHELATMDWDRFFSRLVKRGWSPALLVTPLMFALLFFIVGDVASSPWARAGIAAGGTLLYAFPLAYGAAWLATKFRVRQSRSGDLVATYRAQLEREARQARGTTWALSIVFSSVLIYDLLHSILTSVFLTLVMIATAAYDNRVRLPRVRRELEALGPRSK